MKSSSPVFVARFVDGVITRMTIWHGEHATFDLGRGVRLSRAAYESREKAPAVPIVSGHFEDADGNTLASYNAEDIAKVQP